MKTGQTKCSEGSVQRGAKSANHPQLSRRKFHLIDTISKNVSFQLRVNTDSGALEITVAAEVNPLGSWETITRKSDPFVLQWQPTKTVQTVRSLRFLLHLAQPHSDVKTLVCAH